MEARSTLAVVQRAPSIFRRLALSMGALGVAVGLLFPPFAGWMLDSEAAYHPAFWVACVCAGMAVGGASFSLTYAVVGRHVRRLAVAMGKVNERVTSVEGIQECGDVCSVPVTSSDALGDVETAFNDMALAVSERIRLEVHIGEMMAAAATSAELGVVSQAVLDGLMRAVGSQAGMLFSVSGSDSELVANRGFDEPPSASLQIGHGPVAEALDTSTVVVLEPEADGLAWVSLSTPVGSLRPKAVALVPLIAEQRPVAMAVLCIASRAEIEKHIVMIDGCRHRAGPQLLNAILHKKLQEIAALDELTGVLNRRFGMRRLKEEHARSMRHGVPVAVFLLDIDQFKKFNDTHGHDAGDEVLRRVAKTLESSVRSSDIVCRYGGEEFLVIAPGAGTRDGFVLADRLRGRIEAVDVQWKGQRLAVRASFGVASWPSVSATDVQELISHADQALYQAKGAGRNRVHVHDGTKAKPGAECVEGAGGEA